MTRRLAFMVLVTLAFATPASAEPARKALFEITLDIDRDGKPDRAVLVGPESAFFSDTGKGWYMVGVDERIDLYVYLAVGDAPLDLSKQPTFLKRDVTMRERNNQAHPLEATAQGSLRVSAAYALHGAFADDALTIVYRRGDFLVAGLTHSFELKDGDQGSCDINFLTGKGVASKGLDGKNRPLKQRFAPVKLADWSAKSFPKACGR